MTASVAASSGLAGWRVAVIAAVSILAIGIGITLGGALLTRQTSGLGGATAYVPASAPFYLELRLQPSAEQDAALRDLLGRFPPIESVDLDAPLYGQLGPALDDVLVEEGAGVSWSADVEPWFDGHVGVAVLDVPLAAMSGANPEEVPPMLLLLGVTDAAAAEASVQRILTESGAPTFSQREHEGVTIYEATDEGAWAVTVDQLLVAPSGDDVAAALDANASGATTLAEAAEITRLSSGLPSDWLAFAFYDFTDLMTAALDEAAAASPAMADAFGSLFADQLMRGAMAVTAAGDRLSFDGRSDAPQGDFAAENAVRGLAGEVPADALYFSEAGNIGRTFGAVIGPMKESMSSVPEAAEQIDTLEAALGAELEELVSWIGDGAMAIGYDGTEAYAGLVLVPLDRDAAERRLDQLASFAALAGSDPSSGVSVEESEIAGVPVTTIRWESPDAMSDPMLAAPTAVSVQYAVTDDRVFVGLGESFVARTLELEAADALAAVPRYGDAIEELGGTSNAGVTWIDLAGVRDALEVAMGPMLGMIDPSSSYEAEVRPWLLPLDRFVAVSRIEDGVLVQRSALLVE